MRLLSKTDVYAPILRFHKASLVPDIHLKLKNPLSMSNFLESINLETYSSDLLQLIVEQLRLVRMDIFIMVLVYVKHIGKVHHVISESVCMVERQRLVERAIVYRNLEVRFAKTNSPKDFREVSNRPWA